MTDFDDKLRVELGAEDERFIEEMLAETGYYKEAFESLRGPGRAMNILVWVGILIFSGLLIYFLILAFQADTTREQILFAALAVMLNSAQIALKLWFNMRLNRQAVLMDIRRLRFEVSRLAGA
ncbi:MAG: DUF6768 family protein [Pseudomonadota bacterium]